MRRMLCCCFALAVAAPARAEVVVKTTGGAIALTSHAAPLSEVLSRLGRHTGMKVVYQGSAPRQRVTVSLTGATPAHIVHDLLAGRRVSYTLAVDGETRATTLTVAGPGLAPPGHAARAAAPAAEGTALSSTDPAENLLRLAASPLGESSPAPGEAPVEAVLPAGLIAPAGSVPDPAPSARPDGPPF